MFNILNHFSFPKNKHLIAFSFVQWFVKQFRQRNRHSGERERERERAPEHTNYIFKAICCYYVVTLYIGGSGGRRWRNWICCNLNKTKTILFSFQTSVFHRFWTFKVGLNRGSLRKPVYNPLYASLSFPFSLSRFLSLSITFSLIPLSLILSISPKSSQLLSFYETISASSLTSHFQDTSISVFH